MTLRVGVIGIGSMGKNHSRVIERTEGLDLVAVYDINLEGQELDSRPGLLHNDLDRFLDLDLDYVVNSVSTTNHLEISLILAEHKTPMLLEKPVAPTLSDAQLIIEAFDAKQVKAGVGHIERYNPALQEAKKRIDQVGNIYQISTFRQGGFSGRIKDVGVTVDLATHDFDLTQWLVSSGYQNIFAMGAFASNQNHEDLVSIIGKMENGVIANHSVNWVSPYKERRVVITGSNGALIADTLTADLTFYENGSGAETWSQLANFRGMREGNVIRYAIEKYEPLKREHEEFRDFILGKSQNIVSLKEATENINVAERVMNQLDMGK
jgi:UDP-N-acetylglucosamine 3-dehydrogenase